MAQFSHSSFASLHISRSPFQFCNSILILQFHSAFDIQLEPIIIFTILHFCRVLQILALGHSIHFDFEFWTSQFHFYNQLVSRFNSNWSNFEFLDCWTRPGSASPWIYFSTGAITIVDKIFSDHCHLTTAMEVPSPRTPPAPPPVQRLGSQTFTSLKNKIWGWFGRIKHALSLPPRPPSLQSLWIESTPSSPEPSWLQSGGNSRTSCINLWNMTAAVDFRLRYSMQQVEDLFAWMIQQLQTISKAGRDTAHRLARLEALVGLLDDTLACCELQCQRLLFEKRKDATAKPMPSKTSAPSRSSSVKKPQLKKKFAIKSSRNYQRKKDAKRIQELEDTIDKLTDRVRRLLKVARNTEKVLKANGCMADNASLSEQSDSEMD